MMTLESANEIFERNIKSIDFTSKPKEQMVAAFYGIPSYAVIEQGKLVGFCNREEAVSRGLISYIDSEDE